MFKVVFDLIIMYVYVLRYELVKIFFKMFEFLLNLCMYNNKELVRCAVVAYEEFLFVMRDAFVCDMFFLLWDFCVKLLDDILKVIMWMLDDEKML